MHSLRSSRGLIGAVALALGIALALPSTASAGPETGAKRGQGRGFRLFARPLGAITINRVYLGLANQGLIGVDSSNSSTIGGGFWPKGTPNQYVFNSGLQVAGVIQGTKPANPWGGDTTGGFFFDARGLNEHGVGLTDIYNATNLADAASWPTGAFVPQGDESEDLFNPLLRGRISASQGDVWWMSWEGDPGLNAGRKHPLGIAAEYRGLGWNYPAGNEDIVYFILTFYNITSSNAADYAQYRPGVREILVQASADFHRLNNARFGITLPAAGYTIGPMFSAFAADMDVGDASHNFASVNLPFALGYAYDSGFSRLAGWAFDPAIFGAPFFSGAGFVGVKYLKSPTGIGAIQLFGNTTNGGAFPDPNTAERLYRYLSGNIQLQSGDPPCNNGDPLVTRVCFVAQGTPFDVRFFQSSTALTLAPGGSGSIVVAYIHAAPVAIPGYVQGVQVDPQDPRRLTNVSQLVSGANRIDSITGFRGFTDANADGIVQQGEIQFVPRSLLGKSLTAQTVFDNKFLLPFSPESPEFFLIPGDNQVIVLWKPSATETEGDAFFAISSTATRVPDGGGAPVTNALYDPNYRQFDVEGYRVYRGRVDSPTSLRLIAQFDYNGTLFRDFGGQITNAGGVEVQNCAPEIGVTSGCPITFSPITPGVTRTQSVAYDLSGEVVQVIFGNRSQLISGSVIVTQADSAVTGLGSGFPALSNTGVPFVYVDNDVRNGLQYFYAVTAFDVNSIQSGPSSLESPRVTKRVTPGTVAGNYVNTGEVALLIEGRGKNMSAAIPNEPTIDQSGRFSGPARPANGGVLGFVGAFIKEIVSSSGSVRAKLDSLQPGQFNLSTCCGAGATGIAQRYFITVTTGDGPVQLIIPIQASLSLPVTADRLFNAISADGALAARFGGDAEYRLQGQFTFTFPRGPDNGAWGLGIGLVGPGYSAADLPTGVTSVRYNGERWFDGPSGAKNEVEPNPTKGACGLATINSQCGIAPAPTNPPNPVLSRANFSNAGKLTGVTSLYVPRASVMFDREWRNVISVLQSMRRAADFNVHWGAAGRIDSIIDATHNVPVPFKATDVSNGWGILNQSATTAPGAFDNRPGVLTPTDWTCVEPFKTRTTQPNFPGFFSCTAPAFQVSQTAILGPIAYHAGSAQSATNPNGLRNPANLRPQGGFSLIISGSITFFEMAALPAAGTIWTLRNYSGVIYGGNGGDQDGGVGNTGPYSFAPSIRPFTAVGAEVVASFSVTNEIRPSTQATLARVHTVPDPYYVTSAFETTTTTKIIKFVNLPEVATIRIYTSSGVLVRVLKQNTGSFAGELTWDVRNRNNQFVASGVYFYHVEAENGESTVGRMTVINYAQ